MQLHFVSNEIITFFILNLYMSKRNPNLPFAKQNYYLMLAGLAVLFLGFVLMSLDTTTFGFGFLGLTLGPIVVFVGFMMQFFALLYKPKGE